MTTPSRNVQRRAYFRARDAAKKARRAALRAGRALQREREEAVRARALAASRAAAAARAAQKPPPPPREDGRTARFRWAREAVAELQQGRERLQAALAAFREALHRRAS